jgi:hypothetical protein
MNQELPKKRRWVKPCLLALLAVSGAGLAADITTRAEADILNKQVSPIIAYPFVPGEGYPFLNGNGPAQKLNCTYTPYFSADASGGDPAEIGDCYCNRGFGCACTIEKCPPAQEYEQHFNSQLGCNITSICTRLIAFLGIGGWLMAKWSNA